MGPPTNRLASPGLSVPRNETSELLSWFPNLMARFHIPCLDFKFCACAIEPSSPSPLEHSFAPPSYDFSLKKTRLLRSDADGINPLMFSCAQMLFAACVHLKCVIYRVLSLVNSPLQPSEEGRYGRLHLHERKRGSKAPSGAVRYPRSHRK